MRILLVHNYYQQPGGEDVVFAHEKQLLLAKGHQVDEYTVSNDAIEHQSAVKTALETVWSQRVYQELSAYLQHQQPDLVHFHNTFLQISPAAYYACRANQTPIVQTLHNYRLLCLAANFFRHGQVCEDCLQRKSVLPGIAHACYRSARSQSAVVAAMLTTHRLLKTWQQQVDVYITLTNFAKQKFIEGGLPPEKLVVKPNFAYRNQSTSKQAGQYALFVGRLDEIKGIQVLLEAWRTFTEIPLKIVGDGPLRALVMGAAEDHPQGLIHPLGHQPREVIFDLMNKAAFLILPTTCYEGFPMTIVEAYACGLPVIGSKLGSTAEIIEHGQTGLHFTPGNPVDLAEKVGWAWAHPEDLHAMGQAAQRKYERLYTPEQNYQQLLAIYEQAIAANGERTVKKQQFVLAR